jgi:2-polyprenyl-6-methoxyphenol hydroxylase-like FAD-dependent oxidoreductase
MMQRASHALVIGGSMAGLLTGRILANHFDQVTIIERDYYPKEPAPRRGVPQSGHFHILLSRGRKILEQLFPGLQDELVAAGAPLLTPQKETVWFSPAGWAIHFTPDRTGFVSSRDLLDWTIRRRLASFANVRFLEGTRVTGLLANSEHTGVAGAVVRFCDKADSTEEKSLYADLVVDASGKVSKAPQWLQTLGYAPPQEIVINGFFGYASRIYQAKADCPADWHSVFVSTAPPSRTRGGAIFPIEGKRWIVSLGGGGGDYPPTEEAGFLEFAHSLPTPLIYNAIKDAQPLTPISSYRGTENRIRHYDRLFRYPENFVVVGDAACAFNPVYGQGMTVAALSAQILDQCLNQRQPHPDCNLKGLSRQVQQKLAHVHSVAWLFATSQDYRYRGSAGGKPSLVTQLMIQYMDQVLKLITEDADVCQTFLEVVHMIKPPANLFHPSIVVKAIGQIIKPSLSF